MNKEKRDLAIIMLNFNGSEDTMECIESLDKQTTGYQFDTYILDNGSTEENYTLLKDYFAKRSDYSIMEYSDEMSLRLGNCLIHSEVNFGFAKGNNKVTRLVMDSYRYVVLLNNDTVVDALFVDKMLNFLSQHPDVKYASCRINNYYDRSLLWNCGGVVQWWGNKHYFTEAELVNKGSYVPTSFISGCALFLDTQMLSDRGLLTEDFFHGEEDFNFCWRMHRDKVVGACLKETLVYHKVSVSSKKGGVKIGKIAGYYANRIIDMHKFYPTFVWEVWRRLLMLFVWLDCKRKGHSQADVKEILRLIKKYSYNTQLTFADCKEMGRF